MKKKVFLVDDEEIISTLINGFLEEKYDVKCFLSGEACLEALSTENPDAIIVDAHMPGMDGLATCEAVRKRFENMPIVLMSANESEFEKNLAIRAGAQHYLGKPIRGQELMGALNRLVPEASARIV